MTDKPTPEQIQRACDLANGPNDATPWFPGHYGACTVITALADTIAQLDAMQAERDKARSDLGAISRLLDQPMVNPARAIAAPYRVETDPLEAEADKLMAMDQSTRVIVLSALKRGLEIGRQA